MNRNPIALTMISLSLAASVAAGQEYRNTTVTPASSGAFREQVKDSQPFTHVARVPADFNKGTIRFEGAKMVRVPTRIAYTMNSTYLFHCPPGPKRINRRDRKACQPGLSYLGCTAVIGSGPHWLRNSVGSPAGPGTKVLSMQGIELRYS